MNARAAAAAYLARGWMPIPASHRQKRPTLAGWPQLRVSESTLDQYFNGQPQNVGVLMGEPSGGLTDADLDARLQRPSLGTGPPSGAATRRPRRWPARS